MSDTPHFLSPFLCLEAHSFKLLSVAVAKHHDWKQRREERVYFCSQPIGLYRNSGLASLEAGGRRHKECCFLAHSPGDSVCFLICDLPRGSAASSWLGPIQQPVIKKVPHLTTILGRHVCVWACACATVHIFGGQKTASRSQFSPSPLLKWSLLSCHCIPCWPRSFWNILSPC